MCKVEWRSVDEALPTVASQMLEGLDGLKYEHVSSDWYLGVDAYGDMYVVSYEATAFRSGWYDHRHRRVAVTHWAPLPLIP